MIVQLSDQRQSNVNGMEATVRQLLGSRVRDFRLVDLGECLVLSGKTTTYYAKQLAQHAILTENRTAFVVNNIEVIPDLPPKCD